MGAAEPTAPPKTGPLPLLLTIDLQRHVLDGGSGQVPGTSGMLGAAARLGGPSGGRGAPSGTSSVSI